MTEYQACTNNSLLSQWSRKAKTSERLEMGNESYFFRSPSGVTRTELKNPRVKLPFFDKSSPEPFDQGPVARFKLHVMWECSLPYKAAGTVLSLQHHIPSIALPVCWSAELWSVVLSAAPAQMESLPARKGNSGLGWEAATVNCPN